MELLKFFKIMAEKDASDLFLSTKAAPAIKVHGRLHMLDHPPLDVGSIQQIAYELMNEEQIRVFEAESDINLAFSQHGLGRFRVNVFKQRNEVSMVVRSLKVEIPSPDDLGLPETLKEIIMRKSGLIIVTGATGVGKSTTLASLIKYRSLNTSGHIITVEDPIEFLHRHTDFTLINQREIGVDTKNYETALANALRQAPDMILIGEVRTLEAMEYALRFAETGHLCLTTLHAHSADQAIDRIINFFTQDRHKQLLLDLSTNLVSIISQRLIPTTEGKRVAAFEIMVVSPLIADLIKAGRIDEVKEVMEKTAVGGMQTFDKHLYLLYQQGKISLEDALQNADSPNNLRIRISLNQGISVDGHEFSILPDN